MKIKYEGDILAPNFDKNKRYWYIITPAYTYKANSILDVMLLWHSGYEHNDNKRKVNPDQIGSVG